MSQVIGNPDELKQFAKSLDLFIDSIKDASNRLNGSFDALGNTWQDEKRYSFEEDYRTLLEQISHFEESAVEQIEYLHRLASKLEDYLQS